MRVLYLAGSGRSGSTLVTTILGQLDGFFAAGELRYLWSRGLADNRPCGCGAPFRDCPLWKAVCAPLPPLPPGTLGDRMRMRHLPALLRRRRVGPHPGDATLTALYRSIADRTGGAIIVDSSKLPPYGALLAGLPGIDLRVLHLVRDPRAAAYSWRRKRKLDAQRDDAMMTRHPVWKAALLWQIWNAATVRLFGSKKTGGTYLRVRYEDLVAEPAGTVRRIAEFAGAAPGVTLPFDADGLLHLAPTHSVAGNPARHRTGGVPIAADDEWRAAMPRADRAVVTALTTPLRGPLGYRGGTR